MYVFSSCRLFMELHDNGYTSRESAIFLIFDLPPFFFFIIIRRLLFLVYYSYGFSLFLFSSSFGGVLRRSLASRIIYGVTMRNKNQKWSYGWTRSILQSDETRETYSGSGRLCPSLEIASTAWAVHRLYVDCVWLARLMMEIHTILLDPVVSVHTPTDRAYLSRLGRPLPLLAMD